MANINEAQAILEQDKLIRASGNRIRIRQPLELVIYELLQPFDIRQATIEEISARALNFRRLDILLGRDPRASEFNVDFSPKHPELQEQTKIRPPPTF